MILAGVRIIPRMHGLHLTADLHGCPAQLPVMSDVAALRQLCLAAVHAAQLQAVGELFHRFAAWPGQVTPPGITGMVLLAESHLAVHTWPEWGAVTLDVYICNLTQDHSAQAHALLAQLCDAFAPTRCEQRQLVRGSPAHPGEPAAPRPEPGQR